MDRIEAGLHAHFASLDENSTGESSIPSRPAAGASNPTPNGIHAGSSMPAALVPFSTVDSVAPDSPAEEAGLKAGDRVKKFGPVDYTDSRGLARVAEVVRENENRAISVVVERATAGQTQDLELSLTPRSDWGGRGTLGCHLVP
jgi:26S proteasome non-ATPase regulatory subunit 9